MKSGIVAAILAVLGVTYAHADNPTWKKVGGGVANGGWDIGVDRSHYGCFALGMWEKGTGIRFGFDADREPYMWLFHEAWQSLENGKRYVMSMQFDGSPRWTGPAYAHRADSTPYLSMSWGKDKAATLFNEFAVSQGVSVWYGDRTVARLRLTGSYAAVQELFNCQKAMNEGRPAGQQVNDPFGERESRSDPFSR